jgi:hypothetical protein
LHDRPFTDECLKPFHSNTKLQQLVLANASGSDAGVSPFGACLELRHLDLNGTKVTAAVLPHFHKCKQLGTLFVKGTGITREQLAETAKQLPQCRIEFDGGVIEPGGARDRELAEFVISKGGFVFVNGEFKSLGAAADLPTGAFALTGVLFPERNEIADADLARFAGFNTLKYLSLVVNKNVTDTGLAHFKGNAGLTHLYLVGVPATDAGLAHFKDCAKFGTVDLSGTKVTSAGLAHLSGKRNSSHFGRATRS